MTRATGMPARRAAFSLPPTARTSRPNTVLRTAQAAAATITAIRMTWNGTPATRPRPMNWKSGAGEGLQVAVGHHLGDAAPGDEQDQRADDRLDAEAGDQPAVEEAEQAGDEDREDEGERGADRGRRDREQAAAEDQRGERAADRHQGADREVDAAGRDDERHADADDHDGADLGQVDVQRLERGEVGREGEVERDQQEKREERAEAGQELARPGCRGRGGDEPGLSHARAPRRSRRAPWRA